jgi:hypothetical protein
MTAPSESGETTRSPLHTQLFYYSLSSIVSRNPIAIVFAKPSKMSSKKEVVQTDATPKPFPVMPFSAAVKSNGMVYLSGNIGMDPKTLKLVEGDIRGRTVRSNFFGRYLWQ